MFTSRTTIGVLSRLAVFVISFLPLQLQAGTSCGRYLEKPIQALTLKALEKSAQGKIDEVNRIAPPPQFMDLNLEYSTQWPGIKAPLALQGIFSSGISFEPTPAPGTESPMAVNLLREGVSLPFHISMTWEGEQTSTTAYASLPAPITAEDKGFIVGSKYPVVIVHVHGGGTPTATGKNAMSIGQHFAKRGVPVVGFDMMGHGRGPRLTFLRFKKQIDWLMAAIDKTIAPETQVVLSGHSWGGEFAAYMHRLSKDPKYSRITKYISLSPPVDMSLGKNDESKHQFEEWIQTNFQQFAEQAAESDLDFMTNMVENGKMSSVGFVATTISSMDYLLPPLTPEEQAELKPLLVIQGLADILVYLGREKEQDAAFGGLQEPSRFVKLGPGYKFQGKGDLEKPFVKTGHNIFDRFIDGTEIPQTYTEMAKFILGDPDKNMLANSPEVTAGQKMIDEYIRQWANFFQFRELTANYVAYDVERGDTFQEVTERKVVLAKYLRQIDDVKKKLSSEARINLDKALKAHKLSLGLNENTSPERAQWELSRPDLTPERVHELKLFIDQSHKVEDQLRSTFVDPISKTEFESLWNKYRRPLEALGLVQLKEYESKFQEYVALKGKLSPEQSATRSMLSQVHQQYSSITRAREARFNQSKIEKLSSLAKPEGIADAKEARRELDLNRLPEYRQSLKRYLETYQEVVQNAEIENSNKLKEAIAAIVPPENISGEEQASHEHENVDALLRFRFVPAGNQLIAELVTRLKEIDAEREKALEYQGQVVSRNELEKNLEKYKQQIANYQSKWAQIWADQSVSSDKIKASEERFKKELQSYSEANFAKDKATGEYLRRLKSNGQLTKEAILNRPAEILKLEKQFLEARGKFFKAREHREKIKWAEAIAGHLQGAPEVVELARTIATQLSVSGTGNLARAYLDLNEFLENSYQKDSVLFQELESLQYEYVEQMKAAGFQLPNKIFRVRIADLLEQSYQSLVADLDSNPAHLHAMNKMMRVWHEMVREMRTESQTKPLEN